MHRLRQRFGHSIVASTNRGYELCADPSDRSFLNRWHWFANTEELIKSSLCAIAVRLAQDAVDRGQRDEAMTILRTAFSLDPNQEKLREYEAALIARNVEVVPLRPYLVPRQAAAPS